MLLKDVARVIYEKYKDSEKEVSEGFSVTALSVATETIEEVETGKGKKKKIEEVKTYSRSRPAYLVISLNKPNSVY